MKEQPPTGGMWNLYKKGGITPAISSMFGGQNAQQMAFIRSVMKEQRKTSLFDIPLKQLEFVVFDLETTGFFPAVDEIISLGAVEMNGNKIENDKKFYSVVNCKRRISPEIEQLTGITNEMAREAPDLIDILHGFFEFVHKRILIAHGTGHDKQFLDAALRKTSKVSLSHRLLDTMMIGKWLHPHWPGHSLDELLEHYSIPVTIRHHAYEDALMTAELWSKMLDDIYEKQVVTLGDLYAYLST